MAKGDIHNATGTVCKADKIACPIQGGHSDNIESYVAHHVEESGVDESRVKELIADGLPPADAVYVAKQKISETGNAVSREAEVVVKPPTRDEVNKRANEYLKEGYRSFKKRIENSGAEYPSPSYWNEMGASEKDLWEERALRKIARIDLIGEQKKGAPPSDSKEKPASKYVEGVGGQSESKAIRELPKEGKWDRSISASVNYRDENGEQKAIELVSPVGRLTDKKRIEIGRQLYVFTGQDPKRFEDVSDEEKLRWSSQRIIRNQNYSWTTSDDGEVSYSHDLGSGGSHSGRKIKMLDI